MRRIGDRKVDDHGGAPTSAEQGSAPTIEAGTEADERLVGMFTLHYPHLVRLARHLLDDPGDSEDVVMEAFAGLYRQWSSVRNVEDPYYYLRSSIINASRSRRRRLVVARRHEQQLERLDISAEDAALVKLANADVQGAIRALSRRQREVLVLRYYDGASEAEIALVLGISGGSVKTHASRALQALARQLGEAP